LSEAEEEVALPEVETEVAVAEEASEVAVDVSLQLYLPRFEEMD